jgi:hypothetical protein
MTGRRYIPLIQGEIYGLEIGIDTEMNLWEHSRKLNHEELDGNYLIGFGVGFTKAQQIRERIKEGNLNISFEEKLDLFKFLLNKYGKDYVRFTNISKEFLRNIDNWANTTIPIGIINETILLLNEKKLQRALNRIDKFNYEEFRLRLITEYEEIKLVLPNLREKNKSDEINSDKYKEGKVELEHRLLDFLNKN